MSHVPHELADEFPNKKERIRALKTSDTHFSRLYDAYHAVNRAIHRAETNVEPTDDFRMSEMRKERMNIKDKIAGILCRV